jgi:plasmid stability protein
VSTIQINLDDKTLDKMRRIAAKRHASVEALIEDLIRSLATSESSPDPLLGMFVQEPDLLDAVVESAMQARDNHPLRLPTV